MVKFKKSCHYEDYTKVRYIRVCKQESVSKNVTVCNLDEELKNCGGNNYLSLSNFYYKLGNSTWENVQNINNKEIIYNGTGNSSFKIKFKVNIPDPCYGNYTLDGSNLFFELHE